METDFSASYDLFSGQDYTPKLTNWTGVDAIASGGDVNTAVSSNPSSPASATGLLDSVGKTLGSVADYGFKVQQNILSSKAQSQDLQFKTLMQNLGFKTAVTQANANATVAGLQAQTEVVKAQKQATAAAGGGGLSLPVLALLGLGIYMVAKK
jgi:hypothetical protein